MVLIGVLLTIACVFYGCYANPYWKQFEHSAEYANGIFRAITGIPAWAMVICLMTGSWGGFFTSLVITAGLLYIPFMKLKKDGYEVVKPLFFILMASMGVYARILMAWTIIGLFVTRETKRAAEIGWDGAAFEFYEHMKENESSMPSFTDTINDILSTPDESCEETETESKPEVWRMNGMIREDLKVNSDGTMYYDPDDCEWKRISDLNN